MISALEVIDKTEKSGGGVGASRAGTAFKTT